jgi:hypothetical protein
MVGGIHKSGPHTHTRTQHLRWQEGKVAGGCSSMQLAATKLEWSGLTRFFFEGSLQLGSLQPDRHAVPSPTASPHVARDNGLVNRRYISAHAGD